MPKKELGAVLIKEQHNVACNGREYPLRLPRVADDFGPTPQDPLRWTKLQFRSNNSTSRAFILTLAAKYPRSLITGRAIDTAQALWTCLPSSSMNSVSWHPAFLTKTQAEDKPKNRGSAGHVLITRSAMLVASPNAPFKARVPDVFCPLCHRRWRTAAVSHSHDRYAQLAPL